MATTPTSSALAPFRHNIFVVLWTATLISNVGTWMFNVTSGWIITDLSPSPFVVSMVQAATALPIFLFSLPAGALGDMFNRRRLLLVTQLFSAAVMFLFTGLLWHGTINAWLILLFTFLTGAGTAFAMPAWQAIIPRLVPKEDLPSAISLNGVSVNAARAVGPAFGGFVLASVGATATVAFDAVSYLAVVAGLLWWHTTDGQTNDVPRERLAGAMQAGIRFTLRSKPLRDTLVRAMAFFTFASAYWALLPLVARKLLHGGPGLYGMLLAALGIGAVAGTFLLPRFRNYFGANKMLAMATAVTAFAMMLFAYGENDAAGILAGFICGVSWVIAVSSLSYSVQVALPDWVRARGLAIFQTIFFGAMTIGSLSWGWLAGDIGLPSSLMASALLALLFILFTWGFKLNLGENHDHEPSRHWLDPKLAAPIANDSGPVLVTIEYRIEDADRDTFFPLIHKLGNGRRRDGAVQWGIFNDVDDRSRFIEMFVLESWGDHLRQHARVAVADKILQDRINALHRGSGSPRVTHAVTPYNSETLAKLTAGTSLKSTPR